MADASASDALGNVSGEAVSYGRALAATGRTRVDKRALLDTWAQSVPHLTGSADRLPRLASALKELADAGALRLPAAASWDRDTRPPLPRFVTLVRERAPRPRPWRTHPWRAELGWAASAVTLTDAQYQALTAINTWLANPDKTIVPVRLRSAQILGDEKAVDALEGSAIWGPGKVTHELLRCVRLAPPLATVRVGDGPDVLVVENADPYWALCERLTGADTRIGLLAWGAGGGVEASILSLWQDAQPGTVWYAGDLDPKGVTIATKAASRAASAGHSLHPHTGLWDALATLTPTGVGNHDWSRVDGSWLGPAWQASAHVRSAGGRVAQERLGIEELAAALGVN